MKKFTVLFLVALLCASLLGITAFAAGDPSITVSSAEAEAGETVTITVSIANNPGIAMLELPISYDTTRLEKVEFTAGGLPGGYVNTAGVWISTSDSTYNGVILTLKFKVLDNAPAGEAAVSVDVRSAANWNEEDVAFAVTNGAVTVTAAPVVTDPPATDAPVVTDPPATDAPVVTNPPATDAPTTDGEDDGLDDVPKTGDLPFVLTISALFCAGVALVLFARRKAVK